MVLGEKHGTNYLPYTYFKRAGRDRYDLQKTDRPGCLPVAQE